MHASLESYIIDLCIFQKSHTLFFQFYYLHRPKFLGILNNLILIATNKQTETK